MAVQVQVSTAESSGRAEDCSPEATFLRRGCCCFWNFRSRKSNWERISASEREQQESGNWSWWGKGLQALKKVREWSELVAGPKWKTFIRRFNKTDGRSRTGKFHYDPSSYALNFDEGPGQNGEFEEDRNFRDFSSRYAAINVKSNLLKEKTPYT